MLDYLPEIRSDLSVFHRVEEMESMDSVRFCQLSPLLGAYAGAVAARAYREHSEDTPATPAAQAPANNSLVPGAVSEIPSTQAAVRMSPMSELFSFATSGG